MNGFDDAMSLVDAWDAYLSRHHHNSELVDFVRGIVRSISRDGRRYRWILFRADGDTWKPTPAERQTIEEQIRDGENAAEHVFVVVRFNEPIARLIVQPASDVLARGRVTADKGGIPWEW